MPQHLKLLHYDYVEDIVERRAPHRPAHLELVGKWVEDGRVVAGGATGDPPMRVYVVVVDGLLPTQVGLQTPTLNELHRGFRVGNVVTNPNPQLDPETLTGVEGGVLFTRDIANGGNLCFDSTVSNNTATNEFIFCIFMYRAAFPGNYGLV